MTIRVQLIELLLLAALSAQAQTPDAAVSYGAITGRVTCEDGPLPFASVTVSAVAGRGPGNASRTVTTDAEGNFKVDGLRAAALLVTASAPGYVPESATAAEPDLPAEAQPQPFYRIGDDVTIRLIKGGVITGRVLNPAGDPVIGVRVNAQAAQAAAAPFARANNEAQTDDRGIYRIFGLSAGTYVVVANTAMGGGFGAGFGGGGFGGGGFGGGRGGSPRNPLAQDGPVYYPSGSRAAAAEVVVNSGAETSGIDIQYRSARGFAVNGTVAGAAAERGRGGEFTVVTLTHKASGQVVNTALLMPRGGPGRRGATDNSGPDAFSILGVTDGEYELAAQRNAGGEVAAAAPVRVLVSGNDVTGVSLTLKPLASVRAQLQLESASKCPAPRPAVLEEQVFSLRADAANAGKPLLARAPRPLSVPDRAGELVFRGLAAGRYRLGAQLLDERWFLRAITAPAPATPVKAAPAGKPAPAATRLVDASRSGLTLKAGERLTGVALAVAEGAAALDGKVVNAKAGAPLHIHLIPVERERAEDVLRYAETQTGAGGAFRLRNLAPGKYWLLAQPAPKEPAETPSAWDAATRLRLRRAAEAANQVVELQACQRLSKYELQLK